MSIKETASLFIFLLILVFAFYFRALDNFFAWDDFWWLDISESLGANPWLIFSPQDHYFKPMPHLVWWMNFALFEYEPYYYHINHLAFHAVNSILVCYFVQTLFKDKLLSILSALFFATSFSTTYGVIWIGAWADKLCVFFSLIALTCYIFSLERDKKNLLFFSYILFIFALLSKGTATVLPLLLFFTCLIVKPSKKNFCILVPFFLTSVFYFLMLFLTSDFAETSLPENTDSFSKLFNIVLGAATLFLPQQILIKSDWVVYSTCALLPALVLVVKTGPVRYGFFFILAALVPLMYKATPYTLASWETPIYYVITTPGNRVYLASVAASLLILKKAVGP